MAELGLAAADAQVAFAKAHKMTVRGHVLIWHSQTPAWVFNDAGGNPMTPTAKNKTLLLQRLENHIRGVASHFGNDVFAWDAPLLFDISLIHKPAYKR